VGIGMFGIGDMLGIDGIGDIDGMPGVFGMFPIGIFMPSIIFFMSSLMAAQHGMSPFMAPQQFGCANRRYRPATMTNMPTAMPVMAPAG